MPVSVPSTVSPTILLQVSLCNCNKDQKCMLSLAKAVAQIERLSLVMGQRRERMNSGDRVQRWSFHRTPYVSFFLNSTVLTPTLYSSYNIQVEGSGRHSREKLERSLLLLAATETAAASSEQLSAEPQCLKHRVGRNEEAEQAQIGQPPGAVDMSCPLLTLPRMLYVVGRENKAVLLPAQANSVVSSAQNLLSTVRSQCFTIYFAPKLSWKAITIKFAWRTHCLLGCLIKYGCIDSL